jgi:hypothetical protein
MQKSYKDNTAMSDLLLNMLLGIFFMFAISFMLIAPILDAADIKKPKAEYLIMMTWPDNNNDDVDIWIEDPTGSVLYYDNKEVGIMHLDRDDLGWKKDIIVLSDGRIIKYIHNQEIVTIRGFISGEWIINIHMYKKFDIDLYPDKKTGTPTKVEVKITKLNPKVKIVFVKRIILDTKWQEETITRFTMTANGNILLWSDLSKKLIITRQSDYSISGSRGGPH